MGDPTEHLPLSTPCLAGRPVGEIDKDMGKGRGDPGTSAAPPPPPGDSFLAVGLGVGQLARESLHLPSCGFWGGGKAEDLPVLAASSCVWGG